MKEKIHPKYNYVVFKDSSSDFAILTRTTMQSEQTIKWEDGKEYPLIKVEISSKSHPFYTGKQRIVDTENRVKAFQERAQKVKTKVKSRKEKILARKTKIQKTTTGKSLTLKDMLKNL